MKNQTTRFDGATQIELEVIVKVTHRWESLLGVELLAGEVRASRCVHCGRVRIAADTPWGPRLYYYPDAVDAFPGRNNSQDMAGACRVKRRSLVAP